jgi:hypothetical protein
MKNLDHVSEKLHCTAIIKYSQFVILMNQVALYLRNTASQWGSALHFFNFTDTF